MIFISKNEKGELGWTLILNGQKRVTRRAKPIAIGKILAVQPGRGKKAVGHIRVISCMTHEEWCKQKDSILEYWSDYEEWCRVRFAQEAKREGFELWDTVEKWFKDHKIDIASTYRIEFTLEDFVADATRQAQDATAVGL